MSAWKAPERVAGAHEVAAFRGGEPTLDQWLRKRALRKEGQRASRTPFLRL